MRALIDFLELQMPFWQFLLSRLGISQTEAIRMFFSVVMQDAALHPTLPLGLNC